MTTTFIMMALAGLLGHFLKDLIAIQVRTKKVPNLIEYFKQYPYHTLLCFLSVPAGLAGLHELGELTKVTAFCVGYMSNSVVDVLGKRGNLKGK